MQTLFYCIDQHVIILLLTLFFVIVVGVLFGLFRRPRTLTASEWGTKLQKGDLVPSHHVDGDSNYRHLTNLARGLRVAYCAHGEGTREVIELKLPNTNKSAYAFDAEGALVGIKIEEPHWLPIAYHDLDSKDACCIQRMRRLVRLALGIES